ncbi:MAG: rhodanese-like domain-containing protein [Flavobacteriaceae bacterium]|nr:rhodanese-like domain-containing protein [Flavobacteriaceae bacterium]
MSIFSFLFGSGNATNANVEVLSPEDFKQRIAKGKVQLIDVRTPGEFRMGHIKKAKNINYFSTSFAEDCTKLDNTKPIYLYCKSGGRSRQASRKLAKLGFEEIFDLQGGYMNWR